MHPTAFHCIPVDRRMFFVLVLLMCFGISVTSSRKNAFDKTEKKTETKFRKQF